MPGLAARLPILFSEGVGKGRIDLMRFAALSAGNPARLFGLSRKGAIAVGMDADIAIWNPDRRVTLTNALMQHGCQRGLRALRGQSAAVAPRDQI